MSELIKRGEFSPDIKTDERIIISPEAKALLEAHPELCTREDVANLLLRLTGSERKNIRQIKLSVNEQGHLRLFIDFGTPPGEQKIHGVSFERTENGWEYRGKDFENPKI